LKFERDRLKTK